MSPTPQGSADSRPSLFNDPASHESRGGLMQRMSFAAYNLAPAGDPNRGPERVELESNAIVNNHEPDPDRKRPKVYAVFEAVNRALPRLDRYRLIRSTKNLSVANLALYVRDDLATGDVFWQMHTKTWPRVLHPGTHEARASLFVRVEDWDVGVGHAPQVGKPMDAAREEWLDVMEDFLRQPGPRLLLSDPNALGDDLRKRVPDSVMAGTAVEAVSGRGVVLEDARTPEVVNGVRMLSDHKRCLLGRAVAR